LRKRGQVHFLATTEQSNNASPFWVFYQRYTWFLIAENAHDQHLMLISPVINGMTGINTQSIAGLDVISGWIKAWLLRFARNVLPALPHIAQPASTQIS